MTEKTYEAGTIIDIGGESSSNYGTVNIEVRESTGGVCWKWRKVTLEEKLKLIDALNTPAQGVQEIDAWMRADGSAATVNPMTAGMWKAQGHTIEPLYRHPASQVPSTHQSEAPGDIADRWPIGCHSPASCSRNGKCMYIKCRHDGKDIKALASAFSSTQSGGGK